MVMGLAQLSMVLKQARVSLSLESFVGAWLRELEPSLIVDNKVELD